MTHDSRVRLNGQISEEAAEWFIEFRTGDIDIAGRRAFDAWLRSSPQHLCAYLEIAAIWNEGGSLDARRELDLDTLISLARREDKVISLQGRSPEAATAINVLTPRTDDGAGCASRPTGIKARRLAIAASVAFVVLSAAALLWLQSYGAATHETLVGEQRSIRLADGSLVTLNSRSRVLVRLSKHERAVELLEGQALFQVAKNPARPFVVRSGDANVRAVGTQFDVYKKRSGTIVTVLEGKVAVLAAVDAGVVRSSDPYAVPEQSPSQFEESGQRPAAPERDAAVLLSAGEQLTVSAQAVPRPTHVNVAATTAWRQRQLIFESAPLTEVAEEFNRYSTRKLVVEDLTSDELRLSGVFATDPDFLIDYLRERPDITVHETSAEIRIVRHD
jgi:transmembrane sensor